MAAIASRYQRGDYDGRETSQSTTIVPTGRRPRASSFSSTSSISLLRGAAPQTGGDRREPTAVRTHHVEVTTTPEGHERRVVTETTVMRYKGTKHRPTNFARMLEQEEPVGRETRPHTLAVPGAKLMPSSPDRPNLERPGTHRAIPVTSSRRTDREAVVKTTVRRVIDRKRYVNGLLVMKTREVQGDGDGCSDGSSEDLSAIATSPAAGFRSRASGSAPLIPQHSPGESPEGFASMGKFRLSSDAEERSTSSMDAQIDLPSSKATSMIGGKSIGGASTMGEPASSADHSTMLDELHRLGKLLASQIRSLEGEEDIGDFQCVYCNQSVHSHHQRAGFPQQEQPPQQSRHQRQAEHPQGYRRASSTLARLSPMPKTPTLAPATTMKTPSTPAEISLIGFGRSVGAPLTEEKSKGNQGSNQTARAGVSSRPSGSLFTLRPASDLGRSGPPTAMDVSLKEEPGGRGNPQWTADPSSARSSHSARARAKQGGSGLPNVDVSRGEAPTVSGQRPSPIEGRFRSSNVIPIETRITQGSRRGSTRDGPTLVRQSVKEGPKVVVESPRMLLRNRSEAALGKRAIGGGPVKPRSIPQTSKQSPSTWSHLASTAADSHDSSSLSPTGDSPAAVRNSSTFRNSPYSGPACAPPLTAFTPVGQRSSGPMLPKSPRSSNSPGLPPMSIIQRATLPSSAPGVAVSRDLTKARAPVDRRPSTSRGAVLHQAHFEPRRPGPIAPDRSPENSHISSSPAQSSSTRHELQFVTPARRLGASNPTKKPKAVAVPGRATLQSGQKLTKFQPFRGTHFEADSGQSTRIQPLPAAYHRKSLPATRRGRFLPISSMPGEATRKISQFATEYFDHTDFPFRCASAGPHCRAASLMMQTEGYGRAGMEEFENLIRKTFLRWRYTNRLSRFIATVRGRLSLRPGWRRASWRNDAAPRLFPRRSLSEVASDVPFPTTTTPMPCPPKQSFPSKPIEGERPTTISLSQVRSIGTEFLSRTARTRSKSAHGGHHGVVCAETRSSALLPSYVTKSPPLANVQVAGSDWSGKFAGRPGMNSQLVDQAKVSSAAPKRRMDATQSGRRVGSTSTAITPSATTSTPQGAKLRQRSVISGTRFSKKTQRPVGAAVLKEAGPPKSSDKVGEQSAKLSVRDVRSLHLTVLRTKLGAARKRAISALGDQVNLFEELFSIVKMDSDSEGSGREIHAALAKLGVTDDQIRMIGECVKFEGQLEQKENESQPIDGESAFG